MWGHYIFIVGWQFKHFYKHKRTCEHVGCTMQYILENKEHFLLLLLFLSCKVCIIRKLHRPHHTSDWVSKAMGVTCDMLLVTKELTMPLSGPPFPHPGKSCVWSSGQNLWGMPDSQKVAIPLQNNTWTCKK